MDYAKEIADLIGNHPGFTRYGNKFIYNTMGFGILSICITPPVLNGNPSKLIMIDRRVGKLETENYHAISNRINHFKKRPHQYSAREVFTTQSNVFFVGDKVCVITSASGIVYDVVWGGQHFGFDGKTTRYSFDNAVKILAPYRTERNRLVNNLAQIFGDHPDFFISESGVCMRGRSVNDYWVVRMNDCGWRAWDMFTGASTNIITYEQACDELRRLMLALNPPLIHSEKVLVEDCVTAYPHMMFAWCRIITPGDLYKKKPYCFDDFKKK